MNPESSASDKAGRMTPGTNRVSGKLGVFDDPSPDVPMCPRSRNLESNQIITSAKDREASTHINQICKYKNVVTEQLVDFLTQDMSHFTQCNLVLQSITQLRLQIVISYSKLSHSLMGVAL